MAAFQFYSLDDSYYEVFHDNGLMLNREVIGGFLHKRPYFLAFPDSRQPKIFWMVPVSSRCEKYREIYERKIERYGRCDTIVFGLFREREVAFLTQNMCPCIESYMTPYLDRLGDRVAIEGSLAKRIERKAKTILALERQGIKIAFPNIMRIYRKLLKGIK